VLESLHSDAATNGRVVAMMKQAMDAKWLGKKTGRGFYIHGKKHPPVNEELVATLKGDATRSLGDDEIQRQLIQPMITEMNHLLDEHVTDSDDTVDLATVMGLGLAPFRGGLATYARTMPFRKPVVQDPMHDLPHHTELKHAHV
jgi:3-hydroxyacyl-CoA dehydrogenase